MPMYAAGTCRHACLATPSSSPTRPGWNFYLCVRKDVRVGKGGEYLALMLQDASGQVAGRVFENVERYKEEFEVGEFLRVEGRTGIHNGELQLVATQPAPREPRPGRRPGLSRGRLRPERTAADRRHVERARRAWSPA